MQHEKNNIHSSIGQTRHYHVNQYISKTSSRRVIDQLTRETSSRRVIRPIHTCTIVVVSRMMSDAVAAALLTYRRFDFCCVDRSIDRRVRMSTAAHSPLSILVRWSMFRSFILTASTSPFSLLFATFTDYHRSIVCRMIVVCVCVCLSMFAVDQFILFFSTARPRSSFIFRHKNTTIK